MGSINALAIIIFLIVTAYQSMGQSGIEPSQSGGGAAAFAKFEGIDGEAQDKDHQNWIDIATFNFGGVSPSSVSGQSRRRSSVVISDFVVYKELDKSSPKIFEKFIKGEIIPTVEVEVTASYSDSGRRPYLYFELKNVMVTSYVLAASGQSEDVPMDTFTLHFEEMLYRYTQYDQTGKSSGSIEVTYKVDEGAA